MKMIIRYSTQLTGKSPELVDFDPFVPSIPLKKTLVNGADIGQGAFKRTTWSGCTLLARKKISG